MRSASQFLASSYFPSKYRRSSVQPDPCKDSSPITDNMLRVAVVLFTVLAIHGAVADPQVNILLLFSTDRHKPNLNKSTTKLLNSIKTSNLTSSKTFYSSSIICSTVWHSRKMPDNKLSTVQKNNSLPLEGVCRRSLHPSVVRENMQSYIFLLCHRILAIWPTIEKVGGERDWSYQERLQSWTTKLNDKHEPPLSPPPPPLISMMPKWRASRLHHYSGGMGDNRFILFCPSL